MNALRKGRSETTTDDLKTKLDLLAIENAIADKRVFAAMLSDGIGDETPIDHRMFLLRADNIIGAARERIEARHKNKSE